MEMISEKLDEINKTLRMMVEIIPKPKNKFQNFLETATLFISVLGIIILIDVVLRWIGG